MSSSPASYGDVAALRRAFDRTFAEPMAPPTAGSAVTGNEDLLAIRVAGVPYALRLGAIAAVSVARRITPMPGALPGLLGLAALRGTVVAVYDLRALLGLAGNASPRWIARLRSERGLGLAFDEVEGAMRPEPGDVMPVSGPAGGERHVGELVRAWGSQRSVIDEASIVANIRALLRAAGVREEPER